MVPSLPINPLPNTHLAALLYDMVYCTQFQANKKQSSCGLWLVKNKSPPIGLVSSFTGIHASRAGSVVDTEEASNLEDRFKQKVATDSSEENTYADKIQLASCSQRLIDKKEQERRRKISLANKGKRKGQKHSPETRQRIRESTKAALMDPKIREKMGSSYVLSDESKARISKSLTRVWGKKLKWKRSRAKFLSSWAGSIAEAAKRGGRGQNELQWDSYAKIKEEIAIEQRKHAKIKEEIAIEQRNQAENRKARKRRATPNRKSEEKEALDIAQELKLNERLAKLHKRKTSTNGQISSEDQQAWEKLDLEFIKKEQIRRQVSLADQIGAAKAKRVENVPRERLPVALSSLRENQHSEGFS